jgi:rhodanese-related sulfurtransferase
MMDVFMEFVRQYWMLWGAFAILMFMVIQAELQDRAGGISFLTPQELTMMMNREKLLLIDTRDDEAFKAGHITQAQHIVDEDTLDQQFKKLQKFKDKPVVIYCQTGRELTKMAAALKEKGFTQVHGLKGGVNAWTEQSLPLVA